MASASVNPQPQPDIPPGFEMEPEPAIPPGFELAPPEDPTKPPEPVKPNRTDIVTSSTPNPPTSANPTVPEKPETLGIQMQQLGRGIRKAVMFPRSSPIPSAFPQNVGVVHDGLGNVFAYRRDLLNKSAIKSASRNNKLTEILGSSLLGYGAPDKQDLGPDSVTVAVHDPNGVEVQSTATDERHFPATMAAAKHLRPRGGRISLQTPQRIVHQRLAYPQPQPVDLGIPAELK